MICLALVLAFALIWAPVFAETVPKVAPQNPGEVRLSFAPVVKKVRPAVVNVYASRVETMPRNPLFDDPIFRQFFGSDSDSRVSKSLGSGVIVDPSGLVVTNYHVIEGMTDVKVALSDKREFEAQIVLRDPRTDLAMLKLKGAENFPMLELGDFGRPRSRRFRHRHRQSVRGGSNGDPRHRFGVGAHADRDQ